MRQAYSIPDAGRDSQRCHSILTQLYSTDFSIDVQPVLLSQLFSFNFQCYSSQRKFANFSCSFSHLLVLVTQVAHQNECDHTRQLLLQVNHTLNNWCQYCYSLVGLANLNKSNRSLLLQHYRLHQVYYCSLFTLSLSSVHNSHQSTRHLSSDIASCSFSGTRPLKNNLLAITFGFSQVTTVSKSTLC